MYRCAPSVLVSSDDTDSKYESMQQLECVRETAEELTVDHVIAMLELDTTSDHWKELDEISGRYDECLDTIPRNVEGVDLEVVIGPELIKCPSAFFNQCMVMDGEPFYDWIEGFEYEESYTWTLKVRREEPWGEDGPPETEMSNYVCFLLDVISKEPE